MTSLKKCGVRLEPPAIVITYVDGTSEKLRRRTMPVREFTRSSAVEVFAQKMKTDPHHKSYLQDLSDSQLKKLLCIIQDKMNGISLETSLSKQKEPISVDPNEDLNKVPEDVLQMKKEAMNETFEKNQIKPGDPNFVYDVSVDFEDVGVESCGWDESVQSDPEF